MIRHLGMITDMTAVLWILGGLILLYLLITYAIFLFGFRRFSGNWDPMSSLTHATDKLLEPYSGLLKSGADWLNGHPYESVEIRSFDGLRLRARMYLHPNAKSILVACHGYRSNGIRDFASACRYYSEHGMSILLIDQRACGESEGRYVTFGVKESRDVRDWCAYAADRFPGLPVVLAGISMGAAAVLMTSDDLPEAVTALLSDCGYDSAFDELVYVAKHYVAAPAAVLVPGVGLWCRLIAGFGLRERSAARALAGCKKPVFLVHGEADELVPYSASVRNREACAGPVTMFSVPGADHGMSYLVDHDGYCLAVDGFLRRYVG